MGKVLIFTDKNMITCHICGSSQHKVRGCSENKKIQQFNRRNEAYKPIYNRYHAIALKAMKAFNPIFINEQLTLYKSWNEEWEEIGKNDSQYSYRDAAKANKLKGPLINPKKTTSNTTNTNNKEKEKGKEVDRNTFRS